MGFDIGFIHFLYSTIPKVICLNLCDYDCMCVCVRRVYEKRGIVSVNVRVS